MFPCAYIPLVSTRSGDAWLNHGNILTQKKVSLDWCLRYYPQDVSRAASLLLVQFLDISYEFDACTSVISLFKMCNFLFSSGNYLLNLLQLNLMLYTVSFSLDIYFFRLVLFLIKVYSHMNHIFPLFFSFWYVHSYDLLYLNV